MKKNTCCILFIVALTSTLSIQAQPRLGLKVGIAAANVKAKYIVDYESYTHNAKIGALFGVLVQWPLNDRLFFRPGAELVIKGAKERRRGSYLGTYDAYDYTISQPITYIDIPINLLYVLSGTKAKLLLGGGAVASFNLNKPIYNNYTIRSFDPGINIQTAYEWPIGFSLNLNYTRSLHNISSNKQYIDHFTNYYYGFTVGYIF